MVVCINRSLSNDEISNVKSILNKEEHIVEFDDYTMIKCNSDLDLSFIKDATFHEDEDELVFSNIKYKSNKTIININDSFVGKDSVVIAGPCSIEESDFENTVSFLTNKNINFIRGGISKPRTSVYSYQGLKKEDTDFIIDLKKKYNFNLVSEIVSIEQIEMYSDLIDVFQIGTRNMQNYELLKAVSKTKKPVILKRGMSATLNEFLNSAEYILAGGNPNVILCERGIRTFEDSYRNTLDLNAVVYLQTKTHLPIIVDPSHGSGRWFMVEKLSLASVVCGSDGLIIEVHDDPGNAISDGEQSINFENFDKLLKKLKVLEDVNL